MRIFFSVLLCALCGFTQAADKPNIILIYSDDHGHADLGIHGVMKDIKTPHLDALARSGVVATMVTVPRSIPRSPQDSARSRPPSTSSIIHVRVHLPGAAEIRSLDLKSSTP